MRTRADKFISRGARAHCCAGGATRRGSARGSGAAALVGGSITHIGILRASWAAALHHKGGVRRITQAIDMGHVIACHSSGVGEVASATLRASATRHVCAARRGWRVQGELCGA